MKNSQIFPFQKHLWNYYEEKGLQKNIYLATDLSWRKLKVLTFYLTKKLNKFVRELLLPVVMTQRECDVSPPTSGFNRHAARNRLEEIPPLEPVFFFSRAKQTKLEGKVFLLSNS